VIHLSSPTKDASRDQLDNLNGWTNMQSNKLEKGGYIIIRIYVCKAQVPTGHLVTVLIPKWMHERLCSLITLVYSLFS